MQDTISPEERLLRLIRKDPKKSAKKEKEEEVSRGLKVFAKKSLAKRLSLSGIFNLSRIKEQLSFNLINQFLFATLLILGIYLLADFLIASPNRIEREILAFEEVKDAALEIPAVTSSSVKPVSHYTQTVKLRNLFTASGSKTEKTLPSPSFMQMVSKLKLQGIVSGINPQAIIEDTKTKKVYFLYPGERIGEIELKRILPGEVKLNYYGQEAKLAL